MHRYRLIQEISPSLSARSIFRAFATKREPLPAVWPGNSTIPKSCGFQDRSWNTLFLPPASSLVFFPQAQKTYLAPHSAKNRAWRQDKACDARLRANDAIFFPRCLWLSPLFRRITVKRKLLSCQLLPQNRFGFHLEWLRSPCARLRGIPYKFS